MLDGDTSDKLLTSRELAALLRVSLSAIYRLVERRRIPFHRFEQKLRFRSSDIGAFLAGNRVEKIG